MQPTIARSFCTLFALIAALSFSPAHVAQAQDYDWRAVLSQSEKVQLNVDTSFETSKKRMVPVHFSMGVPFAKETLITRTRFPETQGNLGEMQFLSPDQTLLEFITFSTGTVNGATPDERMKNLFGVIDNQVYPSLTPPETAKNLGGRITQVAGHPAVEYLALFDDPQQGAVAARIVGVIAPNNRDAVFFIQQTMRERMGLKDVDELAKTFGGTMLESLTFQAYRDASGALVAF
ncbi:MAG: hypothetical protein AB8B82_05110 [Roseovarius sp.]